MQNLQNIELRWFKTSEISKHTTYKNLQLQYRVLINNIWSEWRNVEEFDSGIELDNRKESWFSKLFN